VSADLLREQLRSGGIEVYDKDRRWICAKDGRRGYFDDLPDPALAAAESAAAAHAAPDTGASYAAASTTTTTATAAVNDGAANAPDYANAPADDADYAAAAPDANAAYAAAALSNLPLSPPPMSFPPPTVPREFHEQEYVQSASPSAAHQRNAWGQSYAPEFKDQPYYQDQLYYYDRQPQPVDDFASPPLGDADGDRGGASSPQASPAFMQHGMPHWPNAGLGTGFM